MCITQKKIDLSMGDTLWRSTLLKVIFLMVGSTLRNALVRGSFKQLLLLLLCSNRCRSASLVKRLLSLISVFDFCPVVFSRCVLFIGGFCVKPSRSPEASFTNMDKCFSA